MVPNEIVTVSAMSGELASGTFDWDDGVFSNFLITSDTYGRRNLSPVYTETASTFIAQRFGATSGYCFEVVCDIYFFSAALDGVSVVEGNLDSGPNGSSLGSSTSFTATPSAVPIPAAAWLFGSALVGLAGIKRKK